MIWKLLFFTGVLMVESNIRGGRWFIPRRTVTRVVYEKQLITKTSPSSCVQLEPSIKPCRHVRQLQIDPSPSFKILKTPKPELPDHKRPELSQTFLSGSKKDIIEQKDKGSWASYFGLGEVTITQTRVEKMSSRMFQPEYVVTFSVRGCQPSRLPFDLSLCPNKTSMADTPIIKDINITNTNY